MYGMVYLITKIKINYLKLLCFYRWFPLNVCKKKKKIKFIVMVCEIEKMENLEKRV